MEVGQEHIDKYLRNEMGAEELREFLVELEKNPNLSESVEVQRQIVEAIRAEGHASLKQWLAAETSDIQIKPMYGRVWMVAGIAATVVLAVFAYYFMIPKEEKDQIVRNETPVSGDKSSTEKPNSSISKLEPSDTLDAPTLPPPPPLPFVVVEEDVIEGEIDDADFENIEPRAMTDATPPPPVAAVRRDEKLGSKNVSVLVLAETVEKKELTEVAVSSEYKKVQSKEKTITPETEDETVIKNETELIQIELWSSSVNFQGYKFWGRQLILFGPNDFDSISVLRFENLYYLKWKEDYFLLKQYNDYQYYIKLKDQELPNPLKR